MTWNYRVMRSYFEDMPDAWYSIREVYYDNHGEVDGWTVDEAAPVGDTVEELLEILGLMRNCLDKPILDEAELEARKDAE